MSRTTESPTLAGISRQFDVWRFDFPEKGEHLVVLISHPDRCARGALVNVLFARDRYDFKAKASLVSSSGNHIASASSQEANLCSLFSFEDMRQVF